MIQNYKYTCAIDIETFSSVDIKKAGLYKYASSSDFEILIIAFKIDNDPITLLDLKSPPLVESFCRILQNPAYLKTAFNAPFERVCLSKYYKLQLDPAQWECTMAKAYQCGMNGGLDQIAKILKIGEKMKEGFQLMRFFSVPCKPTKANEGRTRNLPKHDPEKFYKYQRYCIKDVQLETEIRKKLSGFEITETERNLWILDQQINDRGILIDKSFVENAINIDFENLETVRKRAMEITGIENPKSTKQLKLWIEQELDEEIDGIGKNAMPAILKKAVSRNNKILEELIDLRHKMSKTSTAKYQKMLDMAGTDNRVKHLFQFCGAARTGRWAGRGIQLHNLPKNDMWGMEDVEQLTKIRKLIAEGDKDFLNFIYDKPASILSQLIRTAFVPSPGNRFIVTDLSAIEARLTAWLAGERWRLEVFKTHGKIYEASASAMFNIPVESITKTSDIRYAGKVAELSLGYGGSVGAIRRMLLSEKTKALEQGKTFSYNPTDKELEILVAQWRLANPNIVQLWYDAQNTCFEALNNPGYKIDFSKEIYFQVCNNVLFIWLPSGRKLCYLRPRIIEGEKGYGPVISYEGKDDKSKWGRIETWGGKLVENIIQAIARDVLAEKMLLLNGCGFKIVAHVHDEIVIEFECDNIFDIEKTVEFINYKMSEPVNWCEDLPLAAETFETTFYRK